MHEYFTTISQMFNYQGRATRTEFGIFWLGSLLFESSVFFLDYLFALCDMSITAVLGVLIVLIFLGCQFLLLLTLFSLTAVNTAKAVCWWIFSRKITGE